MKNIFNEQSLLACVIVFLFLTVGLITACKSNGSVAVINDGKTITRNEQGNYDKYDYEFWTDSEAKGRMILGNSGNFKCNWENTVAGRGNFLARSGKKFNSTQTHSQIGDISIKYSATYSPVGNGQSYLCVYGWARSSGAAPLVEYYIVDNWGEYNRPPGSWTGAVSKGTITVDGGTYDIYETTRTNQPSIEGTKTFQQYWSVRQVRRNSGTISVSEHFKKWESLSPTPMRLGNLYETALCVEGYNIKGSAEITENILSINGVPIKQ